MSIAALIVAAGRGLRAGGGTPKQYRMLGGFPVLYHAITALLNAHAISTLRVVINPADQEHYAATVAQINDKRLLAPVFGGDSRSASVLAGLRACSGETVLIHDGARPLLPLANLNALIKQLEINRGAFLALKVTDALWQVDKKQSDHKNTHADYATSAQPRDRFWRAQTPQGFRLKDILMAYEAAAQKGEGDADDDVAMARRAGLDVVVVEGSERNLKITRNDDFQIAETLMGQRPDIRTGNGFDVHRFGVGTSLVLCGVTIEHERGLIGHSDADVALHAIADAVFGALAKGDIGQWFSPSDPQWKDARSEIFLQKAVELAHEGGFVLNHVDCTIICEMPKIGPHVSAMRKELARITEIDISRISVKATTTERLGFSGRGEGIAVQASATLVRL